MRLSACLAAAAAVAAAFAPVTAGDGRATPYGEIAGPVEARVLEVLDGDSLHVRARIWLSQEVETVVRLAGIDTPELRGRCDDEKERAKAARDFLEEYVAAAERVVLLRDVSQDKYGGRVIATVEDSYGTDFAKALAEAGHARLYDGGPRQPWCPH
ncbi:thermonuclease family protein [Caenispirillum bisanense]|uniref:Nuclease homologue n=1 Tax=Caenispirillum bisanense TaxID=414052 RepID=A0A286GV71_9PROT|nr:thermonuclease family protein [Caenispirillum bisanense]SOD98904.1 nuclease homologue [Caenispirillum bisanense]